MELNEGLKQQLKNDLLAGDNFLAEVIRRLEPDDAAQFAQCANMKELETALGKKWRGISYKLSTNSRALNMVKKMLSLEEPKAKIKALDVGCGYGGFLHAFKQWGFEPHGVEINEDLIELAHANLSDLGGDYHIELRDIFQKPITEHKFDLITINDVMEHLPDPVRAMALFTEMLSDGGVLAIYAPNGNSIFYATTDPHNSVFGSACLPRAMAKPLVQGATKKSGYSLGEYVTLEAFQNLAQQNNLTFRYLPTLWGEKRELAPQYLRDFLDAWSRNNIPQILGDAILARETEAELWHYVSEFAKAASQSTKSSDPIGFRDKYLTRAWTMTFKKQGMR